MDVFVYSLVCSPDERYADVCKSWDFVVMSCLMFGSCFYDVTKANKKY